MSIYDDTLFVWNMNDCHQSMRPRPELIAVVPGIRNFDSHTADWTTLAVCGGFGLSFVLMYVQPHAVCPIQVPSCISGALKSEQE